MNNVVKVRDLHKLWLTPRKNHNNQFVDREIPNDVQNDDSLGFISFRSE
jgi:hypothetical protein